MVPVERIYCRDRVCNLWNDYFVAQQYLLLSEMKDELDTKLLWL